MLNAGLSTLDYLKSRILPEASQDETTWDSALSQLGIAIAGRMQGHCARVFERGAGVVDEFSAWNLTVTLRRYPVESISSIQTRDPDGTLAPVETTYGLDSECGLLDFRTPPGNRTQRLLVTYTGGWWLDDGGAMPTGATPLPDDILEAWLAEVQFHAETRGIFEAIGLRSPSESDKRRIANGLTDECMAALRIHRRFAGE